MAPYAGAADILVHGEADVPDGRVEADVSDSLVDDDKYRVPEAEAFTSLRGERSGWVGKRSLRRGERSLWSDNDTGRDGGSTGSARKVTGRADQDDVTVLGLGRVASASVKGFASVFTAALRRRRMHIKRTRRRRRITRAPSRPPTMAATDDPLWDAAVDVD